MLTQEFAIPLRAVWNVNGCQTDTLWWPKRNANKALNEPGIVFMFICGNPGVIDYYTAFLDTVHQMLGNQLDIVGVSHPGHTTTTGSVSPDHTSLSAQIKHKIACLDRLRITYPPGTQFVLAGHSVGSYIALQVLDACPDYNITRVICLFPTIKEIRDTPNGHNLSWMWSDNACRITSFGVGLLGIFPLWLRLLLTRLCAKQTAEEAYVTVTKFLSPTMVRNSLSMACDEMETITTLQTDLIDRHLSKLLFYYGTNDHWSPISHYEEMTTLFPKGQVYLCQHDLPHAFVLGHGAVMGELVAQWLKELL
ncbi:hypothetical protein BDF19DRAFT_439335 [Syncephalis fuscata]|nr:hypothetical protein BDF19DRAFT_439335 [Syncephalis fuscata]